MLLKQYLDCTHRQSTPIKTNVTKTISRLCTHWQSKQLKQMLLKQYLDCTH